MSNKMFFEDLVFLDKQLKNSDEFFDFVFPILKQNGYVRDTFLAAIKQREIMFPTALPIEPYAIALPHTDIEHIIKPFISITRVKGSVPWCEMANNDNVLQANYIFLLGFIDKNGHISLLQALMGSLSDQNFINQLNLAKDEKEVVAFLESSIQFQ